MFYFENLQTCGFLPLAPGEFVVITGPDIYQRQMLHFSNNGAILDSLTYLFKVDSTSDFLVSGKIYLDGTKYFLPMYDSVSFKRSILIGEVLSLTSADH